MRVTIETVGKASVAIFYFKNCCVRPSHIILFNVAPYFLPTERKLIDNTNMVLNVIYDSANEMTAVHFADIS